MTPGSPVAPGVFCLVNRGPLARPPGQVTDWSDIASCADRGFWRRWHAGALRPPGRRTSPRGKHLPGRHPGRQLDWLLPARLDRPIHAQSHGDFPGLARGHRRRFFRRIHIGESDKWHGRPLHEAIVDMLRKDGFSGATVLRGVGGYGGSSVYHTDKLLRLSQDLPIILEVIESIERIERILPHLDEMVEGGLITLEKVRVILYRAAKK